MTSQVDVHEQPLDFRPMIKTDRQWLQDNILCLLSNAIKFSSGTMKVRVYHTVFPSADAYNDNPLYGEEMAGKEMLRIEVRDEGMGMGAKECESIFEAPDFASQQRKQEGRESGCIVWRRERRC